MPGALPDGLPAPRSGELPVEALTGAEQRVFGLYIHVPFCAARCGYCDFNTYTAAELGAEPGTSQDAYLDAVTSELALAARTLGAHKAPVRTVFFGGGTPTLLAPEVLSGILDEVRRRFDLAPDCEVTTEANPESVTPESLRILRDGGLTRMSFGMQSNVPGVLRVLERVHSPGRALQAVGWARDAGFESVSLDLIYGTPGETLEDWRNSLNAAISVTPDHVSAYSLIVEEGTRLAQRVARGELERPSEDDLADKYALADQLLSRAGYAWYEVSNWAKSGHECRHNLGYWHSDDWWGIGPGAHSHVGGVRWWNVRHPRDYARALHDGSPAAARESLTASQRADERILLEVRLSTGLPADALGPAARAHIPSLMRDGLLASADPLILTGRGRLLADLVVRDLV